MSEADDIVDQLNSLCDDFGCLPGTERISWIREKLSNRGKEMIETSEAARELAKELRDRASKQLIVRPYLADMAEKVADALRPRSVVSKPK